jgi:hypothetical protein
VIEAFEDLGIRLDDPKCIDRLVSFFKFFFHLFFSIRLSYLVSCELQVLTL